MLPGSVSTAVFMVHPRELSVNERGQIVYSRTGTAPCVIHTNAYKTPDLLANLLPKWLGITWVPSNKSRLQRALLRRKHLWRVNVSRS